MSTRNGVVKVGKNFKHFVKFGIQFFQQIIGIARTDEDNFDIERNDFGLKGDGVHT